LIRIKPTQTGNLYEHPISEGFAILLCCLLAAFLASPALLWPAASRAACCGVWRSAVPLALAGLGLNLGAAAFCVLMFTSPAFAGFRHICTVAGWLGKGA
jgi:hypothetical protein